MGVSLSSIRSRLNGPALLALVRSENMRNTLLYLGASAFGAALSMLTIPLFSKYLSRTDFGIVGYVMSINGFLAPFFTLSVNSYYIREYYRERDPVKQDALLSTCVAYTIAWGLLLTALLLAAGAIIFNAAEIRVAFFPFMATALLGNLGLGTFTYATLQYRVQQRAGAFAVLTIAQALLQNLLGLWLVVQFEQGPAGRLTGTTAGTLLAGVAGLIALWPRLRWRFDSTVLRPALQFSLPLIPVALIALLFDTLDRVFLERLQFSLAEIGTYTVAMQYGGMINILALSIYRTYEPTYFKFAADGQYGQMNRSFIGVVALFAVTALVLIFIAGLVIDTLTHGKFGPSVHLSRVLLVGFFLKAVYQLGGVLFVATGRTKQMLWNSLLGLILYSAASYWFLLWFGVEGAAWAKLVPVAAMLALAIAQSGQGRHFLTMLLATAIATAVLTMTVLLLG
jgi:O-antigen/teichoic acid export membrane protein